MLEASNRAGGLEDHRRSLVKEALLMKFPELRAPAREYLYATPEAIEARRKELQHLRSVELPANAEAMRAAKEHGDLSENFEYHAARQRHEYLSARIATLSDELSRTRPLDPRASIASEVRVGTRVRLRDAGDGGEREVTILGPWDSRPRRRSTPTSPSSRSACSARAPAIASPCPRARPRSSRSRRGEAEAGVTDSPAEGLGTAGTWSRTALLLGLLFGLAFAVVTPPSQAPDEPATFAGRTRSRRAGCSAGASARRSATTCPRAS